MEPERPKDAPPSYAETTGQSPYPAGQPYPVGQPYPAGAQAYPAGQVYPQGTVPPSGAVIVQPGQTAIVINARTCPACQNGVLMENFTCAGICLGIFCFPFGLICCLMMKERRCTHCNSTYPASY